MKSELSATSLSGLLFSIVALTSLQASSASLQPAGQQPFLMLAEGGGDRVIQYQEMQVQRLQTTDTDSQRFAQLVEEEPTAAGVKVEDNEVEPVAKPAPRYKSLMHQQRVEFGH